MRVLRCCFYGGRKLNYACLTNVFVVGDSTTTIIIKVHRMGTVVSLVPRITPPPYVSALSSVMKFSGRG